jgi:hypothetical protein
MSGINFSSEYAREANLQENAIENVEQLVGRPQPDQYSADLSLFVLDPASFSAVFEPQLARWCWARVAIRLNRLCDGCPQLLLRLRERGGNTARPDGLEDHL